MDRRDFLKKSAIAASLPISASALSAVAQMPAKSVHPRVKQGFAGWLDGDEPEVKSGATWGKAWPQGELKKNHKLCLLNEQGKKISLQSWPTAFWPDGSIKWTGHAVPANIALGKVFRVEKGKSPAPDLPVRVKQKGDTIEVDTGLFRCRIARSGPHIIDSLHRNDLLIAKNARLVGLRQDQASAMDGAAVQVESFQSRVQQLTVEQSGPVRAVIKLEGMQRTATGREWLPFSLRLYFYAGGESLSVSHSFVFDGDEQKDFIKGLGLRFTVVQRDELYNRHVRFVGEDDGLWAESPKGITGLRRDPGQEVRDAQIAGIKTPPLNEWSERVSSRMHWIPVWNDYTLSQLSANGFSIRKRTAAGHAWIDSDQGHRASGVAYLGGVSGGVLFGMRDFWQTHPVQIDVRNAGADESEATIWFWSPEAEPMDLRFYHDGLGQETYEQQLDALNITYEDYEPGFGTPVGVAHTSNFTLFVLGATPSRQQTVSMAEIIRTPPQVVCAPEDYLNSGVFGSLWSLPDRSTPRKRAIEDRLAWTVEYYKRQIEQHHWYGFWNFGDVMHTYDVDRHVWRYDVGGYAWDNSELSPDLWLWYSFLRTGDPDTFRIVERMTRHNRDVDIYHLGRFKGLGSRHNVQHWGCSAKQLRISSAAYRRFHYYLTADERTGDVLDEVINADERLADVVPIRKLPDVKPMPGDTLIQVGTDWGAVASNWLTAWERSGEEKYRRWLVDAMQTIGRHPQGFFAGTFGYMPKTKKLLPGEDTDPELSHLSSVFGLIEICTELNQLLDVPEFKQAWLKYGRYYNAGGEEQLAALGKSFAGKNALTVGHSRLTAYVAMQENDAELARRAWQEFYRKQEFSHDWQGERLKTMHIEGPHALNPVDEAPWVSTNDASQWGLAAIQNLALVAAALPD